MIFKLINSGGFTNVTQVIELLKSYDVKEKELSITLRNNGNTEGDILCLTYTPEILHQDIVILALGMIRDDGNHALIYLPKELLEFLSYETIVDYMRYTGCTHTIDDKFKDSKKYLQAELSYNL